MATLNHFLLRGKPAKRRLNIIDIFNIEDLLLQRGFEDVTEGVMERTLLDSKANPRFSRDINNTPNYEVSDDFIEKFKQREFRLRIRNMVFGSSNVPSEKQPVDFSFEASSSNQKRYSNTVELVFAYLCVKELRALSASYGVKIANAPSGGDFDCLANFQNSLFHFEIKSGDIKNINKKVLQCFLDRHNFLSPNASVLFLDYQGGSKTQIDNLILRFSNLKIGNIRTVTEITKIIKGIKNFI